MKEEYWENAFKGLATSHYPTISSAHYQPATSSRTVNHEVKGLDCGLRPDTNRVLSTTLHAAWAVLLAHYSGTSDVVFGIATPYRDGVQSRVLPLRIQIDWHSSVAEWLDSVDSQGHAALEPQGWVHLDRILSCSSEAQDACSFRTVILVRASSDQADKPLSILEMDNTGPHAQVSLALECIPTHTEVLQLHFIFDDKVLQPGQVRRMAFQYERIVCQLLHQQCLASQGALSATRVIELDLLCEQDKALLWSWNSLHPTTASVRVPCLFAHQVSRKGESPAIHAWDGKLTYKELDHKSDQLCAWLIRKDLAAPGQVVPVCFDKTMWTTITLIAIAKAGAIFIMLDPHQPHGRLVSILASVDYAAILARPDTSELAQSLDKSMHVIGEHLLDSDVLEQGETKGNQISRTTPEDPLYIVFTSGSTGTPKGVTISHSNLCSAVAHQARALGFSDARTFDSSSYSFDAYVCNTFHTLLTGGCLCVASETDRINKLQSVLGEMQVDFVQLTPSTARILDPAKLPRLKTLILTGERITRAILDPWLETNHVRVINAYGPSECTIMCAANQDVTSVADAESIGYGLGATLWVADLNDVTKLAPVGAVGELLIEGPIVGQGYLGDAQKTRDSLVCLSGSYLPGVSSSPAGPMFRTRDLARYNEDGSIAFIGRADTQIKINGQRVEVGEVEYHLGRVLSDGSEAVVEPVQWPSGKKQLLGFIHSEEFQELDSRRSVIPDIDARLSYHLPRYMMPSAYFPVQSIPLTPSGKTDRRRLKGMALDTPHELIDAHTCDGSSEARLLTKNEWLVRDLWGEILALDTSSIRPDDHFFSHGGDSLTAIRLVSALQRNGCSRITVAHVFQHPRLSDFGNILSDVSEIDDESSVSFNVEPFSLAGKGENVDHVRLQVASLCQSAAADIEDVYPCSPEQEGMLVLGARNPEGFLTQKVVPVSSHQVLERVVDAWNRLVKTTPILRTRIVEIKSDTRQSPNLVQAVLRTTTHVSRYETLDVCLREERAQNMGIGKPLYRVASVKSDDVATSDDAKRSYFVLTMHHAVYDGWLLSLLSEELTREYLGSPTLGLGPYRNFIKYIEVANDGKAACFWTNTFKNVEPAGFPRFPVPDYRPRGTDILEVNIDGIFWRAASGVTPNTLLQAAWAIILSKFSGSEDVVYGATLLGRHAPLHGIERTGGPTLATVPVRIFVDWASLSVAQLLHTIQTHSVEAIPFMHLGMRNIKSLGYDSDRACRFRTFLIVQHAPVQSNNDLFGLGAGSDDIGAFNSYAIMLECSVAEQGVKLRSSFDENVVDGDTVRAMLDQVGQVLKLLCNQSRDGSLLELPVLSTEEREDLSTRRSQARYQHVFDVATRLSQCLPQAVADSAVEAIEFETKSTQLVGFVCFRSCTSQEASLKVLAQAHEKLAESLPQHMLPTKFLIIQHIPRQSDGTSVHDALIRMATESTADRFIDVSSLLTQQAYGHQPPHTWRERLFQRLWADILDVKPSAVGRETSFLYLGGDSLAGMRLVAAARDEGVSLTVAQVLQFPRLRDMAAQATAIEDATTTLPVTPFSLISPGADLQAVALACNVDDTHIEDAYPCSPMQEAFMAGTIRRPGSNVSQNFAKLPLDVDVSRLKHAWDTVAAATPILRTRIVEGASDGLLQVVIRGAIPWETVDCESSLPLHSMKLGQPLMRFDLIEGQNSRSLRTSIHHSIHDRWSASLVLEQVEAVYDGRPMDGKLLPYNYFIRHLQDNTDVESEAKSFWTKYFEDADTPSFPRLPSPKYQPSTDRFCKRKLEITWPKDFTPSTTLKAVWALIVSQYGNSADVLYGLTTSKLGQSAILAPSSLAWVRHEARPMGRHASLPGIERVAGPTMATIPFRSKVDWTSTSRAFLESIQGQATGIIPFEHYGLVYLQALDPKSRARRAFQVQSSLIIQPPERSTRDDQLFGLHHDGSDAQGTNDQAIVVECTLYNNSECIVVSLNYDSHVVDDALAQRILTQMEHLLEQLGDEERVEGALVDMATINDQDRQQVWSWNYAVPPESTVGVIDMISERVRLRPCSQAVRAWDGYLSYGEIWKMAGKLAHHLVVEHQVGPETTVPLCFEKSMWTAVAMLAVILSGATAVALDPTQPLERLRSIAQDSKARLVLTSPSKISTAQCLNATIVCVDEPLIAELSQLPPDFRFPPIPEDNSLYINFTSGSTGTPKGVVVTHKNCSSAVLHQAAHLGFDETTRALDLASYSFDVVWELFIQLLCTGGCLCIPSDDDRRNNIPGAIQSLQANFLDTTPSLARTVLPEEVPSLKRIVFGGEPLAIDDVERWRDSGVEVLNTYGPSECTPTSTIALQGVHFTGGVTLGKCYGLNAWIMSCIGSDNLAPIGAIGELVLEGPLVGKGYLNDAEKTAACFLQDPAWLLHGGPISMPGRQGRLYKTGDLVKYDGQGMLVFMGRKDSQVKLRGQRVELGDVESCARRFLGSSFRVAATVIDVDITGGHVSQVLMLFVDPGNGDSCSRAVPLSAILRDDLMQYLSQTLPAYVVPSTIIFQAIPMTASGKIDRRQLRRLAEQVKADELHQRLPTVKPQTHYEQRLCQLWSTTLGVSVENVGQHDSFLDIGGDSLSAIRLVGAARKSGLPLSVGLVLQHPRLDDMAENLSMLSETASKGLTVPKIPNSIVLEDTHSIVDKVNLPGAAEVSELLHVSENSVHDVLPASDFQNYAIQCALQRPRTEWTYMSAKFSRPVDVSKLQSICQRLTEAADIFRCIFLPSGAHKYVQVFLTDLTANIQVVPTVQSLDQESTDICLEDLETDLPATASWTKFFIIHKTSGNDVMLVMRIPHAQYDGASLPLLASCINTMCAGRQLPPLASFSAFVREASLRSSATYDFWRSVLSGTTGMTTVLTSDKRRSGPGWRNYLQKQVTMAQCPPGVTPAALFTTAWGLALSRVTGSDTVVFGRAVSGRASTFVEEDANHHDIIGPCFNLVPVRMTICSRATPRVDLCQVRKQMIESIPHEHIGLGEIVRKCTSWAHDAVFGSVLYFQNFHDSPGVEIDDDCGHAANLAAIPLDRPDPPEPPRMEITPTGEMQYALELMIHEEDGDAGTAERLLEEMVKSVEILTVDVAELRSDKQ